MPPKKKKEEFLAKALDVLSEKGEAGLKVETLCRRVGVSRGSFYWWWKSKEEFERELIKYWNDTYTVKVAAQIMELPGGPEQKLIWLAETLARENHGKYDLSLRAWAAQNKRLIPLIREVDRTREMICIGLFSQLGFNEFEAQVRARTYQVFYTLELSLFTTETRKHRLAAATERVRMLCRRK